MTLCHLRPKKNWRGLYKEDIVSVQILLLSYHLYICIYIYDMSVLPSPVISKNSSFLWYSKIYLWKKKHHHHLDIIEKIIPQISAYSDCSVTCLCCNEISILCLLFWTFCKQGNTQCLKEKITYIDWSCYKIDKNKAWELSSLEFSVALWKTLTRILGIFQSNSQIPYKRLKTTKNHTPSTVSPSMFTCIYYKLKPIKERKYCCIFINTTTNDLYCEYFFVLSLF